MPAYQRLEVPAIRPAVPQPALRPVVPAYPTCYVYASRVEGSAMIRRAVVFAESPFPISALQAPVSQSSQPIHVSLACHRLRLFAVRHGDSAVAKSPSFPFNSFIFNQIRTLCFSCNRQVLYNQQNTNSLAQKNISGVESVLSARAAAPGQSCRYICIFASGTDFNCRRWHTAGRRSRPSIGAWLRCRLPSPGAGGLCLQTGRRRRCPQAGPCRRRGRGSGWLASL